MMSALQPFLATQPSLRYAWQPQCATKVVIFFKNLRSFPKICILQSKNTVSQLKKHEKDTSFVLTVSLFQKKSIIFAAKNGDGGEETNSLLYNEEKKTRAMATRILTTSYLVRLSNANHGSVTSQILERLQP